MDSEIAFVVAMVLFLFMLLSKSENEYEQRKPNFENKVKEEKILKDNNETKRKLKR